MSKQARIVTGTVLCILVIVAGLAAGVYFKKQKQISVADTGASPSSVSSMAFGTPTPAAPKPAQKKTDPNANTYDVSPPSRGVTLTTLDINIQPAGNTSFVLVPKKDGSSVEAGQKILLYDKDGILLETLGEVTKVNEGRDQLKDFTTVIMTLNGDAAVPPSSVARGKIITGHRPDSQRLPLSALVKSDKGEPYIWEITDNGDGTAMANYTPANVVATTYAYIVIEQPAPQSNVFVLNPDNKLQDGQTININKIMFAAPDQTDESKISALVETRARNRATQLRAALDKANGIKTSEDPDAAPAAEPTAGCPTPPPAATQSFIDQAKKLAPSVPEESLPASR